MRVHATSGSGGPPGGGPPDDLLGRLEALFDAVGLAAQELGRTLVLAVVQVVLAVRLRLIALVVAGPAVAAEGVLAAVLLAGPMDHAAPGQGGALLHACGLLRPARLDARVARQGDPAAEQSSREGRH